MRFIILRKADPETEAGVMPSEAMKALRSARRFVKIHRGGEEFDCVLRLARSRTLAAPERVGCGLWSALRGHPNDVRRGG